MSRYFFEDESSRKQWYYYLRFTRYYPYITLQNQIIEVYKPYLNLISKYSTKIDREIYQFDNQQKNDQEVILQNITLLKNSMQLWRDASNTSEEIAPILHHYCFHCFISFFIYTFFRWKQKHVKSHGVSIKLNDYIPDIEIKFAKKDGIFQRFLDTWTLLGASLAFSPIIPIKDADEISFIKNDDYLLQDKDHITLNELLKFKPREFEKKITETFKDKWIKCQFITGSPITQINNNLKNYLILFTASNIARYRPYMWDLILDGKNAEYNQFASAYITALYDLSINNLLRNVYDLFSSIENKYFSINN